jgi:uncharacterized membrane protein YccC
MAAQTGLAAGIAWFLADDVLDHDRPFFAPIAAVIVLGASLGERLRRAVEILVGVALGILVGGVAIELIGSGAWQVGVSVAVAMLVAVFLGGSPVVVVQSAATAVLVATFATSAGSFVHSRFFDALVGGGVGVLVMALLLPVSPFKLVRDTFDAAFTLIADGLHDCAVALSERDKQAAEAALDRLRTSGADVGRTAEALDAAREASMAPARWSTRGPLSRYSDAQTFLDRASGNARGLARRVVSMLNDDERAPAELSQAINLLAEAVRSLEKAVADDRDPADGRRRTATAVATAAQAYRAGLGFSGGVVVAQIRAVATDLLRATGLPQASAEAEVRRAIAGRTPLPE